MEGDVEICLLWQKLYTSDGFLIYSSITTKRFFNTDWFLKYFLNWFLKYISSCHALDKKHLVRIGLSPKWKLLLCVYF